MKICTKCKKELDESQFHKSKISSDGKYPSCKNCRRIAQKPYLMTEKYKEQVRAAMAKYRKTEHGRAKEQAYKRSERGREIHKKSLMKHRKTVRYRTTRIIYLASERGKEIIRKNNRRMYILYPDKAKARRMLNEKIRKGKFPRIRTQTCKYCGNPAREYHHFLGYSINHWLDVEPVCIPCHKRIDGKYIRHYSPLHL